MPWAAVGAIGAAVVGGMISKSGSNNAGSAIDTGAAKQAEVTKYMFDVANQYNEPFRNVGTNALYELAGYKQVPVYGAKAGTPSSAPTTDAQRQDLKNQLTKLENYYNQYANSLDSQSRYDNPTLASLQANIQTLKTLLGSSGTAPQAAAAPEQQYEWVKKGPGVDVTGGSKKFMDLLEKLDFKLDLNDPIYQWQKAQTEEAVNAAMAARGGYDSRVAINALADANMQLQSNEINRQYSQNYLRQYGQLVDLYNMANQQGQAKYNSLLDLVKIGSGASASAGQNAIYTGSALSDIYGSQAAGQAAVAQQKAGINAQTWEGITNQIPNLINYYSNNTNSNNALYNWGYSPATWSSVDKY